MSTTTVADFVEVLRASQLLESPQLDEIARDREPETDPHTLTRRLVQRGWLTPYQAEQLLLENGQELVLGPYRLLEPIGEGGMGQVFKARHQKLGRTVALKIIHPGRLAQEPEAIRRFQREARAAALMTHPNVVMVYDTDQVGDTYFIAMEYVQGTDLAKLVKETGPLPVATACDYIRQAALGLQHAHEHGMVHRDIKPSNLLVTRQPGAAARPVFRQPNDPPEASAGPAVIKVLDMGLVRMGQEAEGAASQLSLTQEGTVIGTPDYIAPEQARDAHSVDIRADLYSLGCTFYYLLAGRPPFPEGTVMEKLLMHQLDEPRMLDRLRPDVPPGVAMVVRKLMAKRCDDRYQTPGELIVALDRVTPVSRKSAQPTAAPIPRPAAAKLPGPAEPTPAPRTDMANDAQTVQVTAIVPAVRPPVTPSTAEHQGPQLLAVLKGHVGGVLSAAFSADRDTLAAGGVDGTVRVWDFRASRPRERAVLTTHRPTPSTARSLLRIGERSLAAAPGGVHSLAFVPDGTLLAAGSGGMDGLIRLWDLTMDLPMEKEVLNGHRSPVDALAFSPGGRLLASGGNDRTVRVWDLTGPRPRERCALRGHAHAVKAVAFSPDGETLASASQDGTVRLWHTSKRLWSREQAVLAGHDGLVHGVTYAPDGRTLASAGQDQTVRLWDVSGDRNGERVVLQGHSGVVRLVLFTPDGHFVVSVDDRGQVIQWDAGSGQKVRDWQLPRSLLCSVALTFDGRYVAAGTSDGKVCVFRIGDKRR